MRVDKEIPSGDTTMARRRSSNKERKYMENLRSLGSYHGEVLLVGISYGKKADREDYKKHVCRMERVEM